MGTQAQRVDGRGVNVYAMGQPGDVWIPYTDQMVETCSVQQRTLSQDHCEYPATMALENFL